MSDGELSFATAIDTSGFKRGVTLLQNMIQDAGNSLSNELGNSVNITGALENSLKRIGMAVGIAFSANQAWDFAKQIRDVRSEIQSLEISFETLLGSKEKADELFGSIREFAVNTPMQLKDLASAAQTMLSFNISEDKIMPYLKALGDVSMGDTQKFNALSLAFSQMSSAGKLMGQDLMQMINAGFNPLAQMAEKTGKSISELKDEMSAGKITAEMVQQAFIDATSEGGKYFGMLEKQSHGIAGAMSNLQGAIDDMLNEMGEASEGIITGMYSTATSVVKNWKDVAEAIGIAVAAYGMYKTAVMVNNAVDSTVLSVQYTAETEQLSKLIALKEADANADIQAAVASGKLSASKAQEIIAFRAEAASVVESLQAKAAQAKIDAESAIAAEAAAKRRYLESVENMKAASMQLLAAQKSGDVFAISVAQAEVDEKAQKRDADMKAYNAAMTETKAKAQAADVASTTAETAATQLNTAAEEGNAAATSFLSAAKTKLMGVIRKLYATMMAHPYAIALAAVIALAYGIYKLCTQQTNAEKAQAKLNETFSKSEAAARSEMASIDALFNALRKAEQGTSQYKAIKDQIISQYGQYLKGLVDEKNNLLDVEAAYIRVANAAKEAARERAISDATKTAQDTFQQDTQAAYDKIYDKLKKKGGIGQALYDMIKMDLESSGKLSADTINQLYEAYGARVKEKTKNGKMTIKNVYNKDVAEIKNAISEIIGAQDILNDAISETQKRYGNVINDFMSYDVDSLKAERDALQYAIQTNQTKGYQIYLNGSLAQSIENVAEAKLALKKMDEAIAANANKVHRTEMDNYQEKEKAYRDAEAALNDIKANRDKYDEGAYKQAEENYKAAKKAFEDVGGVTKEAKGKSAAQLSTEADVASESLTSVERKQARERKRMQEDLEFDLWQARIDSGKYGSQAYLQQRELDFKKEQTQLQRQMEDAIDAEISRQKELWDKQETLKEKDAKASGRTYTKKAFNSDNLSSLEFKPGTVFDDEKIGDVDMANIYAISQQYAQLEQLLLDTQDKTRQEETKRQQDAMNEYLAQWGDYLQKRQALIDIANAKLNDSEANLTEGEKLSIKKQLEKDLNDIKLDDSEFKKSIDWQGVFGDLSKQSLAALEFNLNKIRDYFNANKDTMDVTQIKDYQEAITKMEDEIASRNPFTALHQSLDGISTAKTNYITAMQEMANAQKEHQSALDEYNDAVAERAKFQELVDTGEMLEDNELYVQSIQRVDEAEQNLTKSKEKQSTAERNVLTARNKVTASYATFANNLKSATNVVVSLGNKGKNLAAVFSDDIANSIGKALDFIDELSDAAASVITAIGDVGKGVATSMNATVEATGNASKAAAASTATAISTVEKASVILTVISAALQVATAIANLFNNDDSKQKEIEKLQGRIEQLQWELDNADTVRLQNNVGDAVENLRKTYERTRDEVLRLHGVTTQSSSWVKWFAEARYSADIYRKSVERIADAYAKVNYTADKALGSDKYASSRKELENLAEQQLLIQKQMDLENSKKKTDNSKIQDYQNKIAELAEKMATVINEILEDIIGYTAQDLAKELGDAFFEAAQQGEDAMKAWQQKANEIIADITKRMLITKFLEEPLGQIFDKYKKKWFGDDGKFKGIDAVVNSMAGFSDDLNQVGSTFKGIWDSLPDDIKDLFPTNADFTQEQSVGGFQSMSEDTGQELNGRFTAMQIAIEDVRSISDGIKVDTTAISESVSLLRDGLDEMQNIGLLQLSQLESINKNTKELADISQMLDRIDRNIQNI